MKMLIDRILNPREKQALLTGLGREPTSAELAMVSAMWSEHCGYKHSRHFLRQLPRAGDHVLAGPGENAGIIRIHDQLAIAFKIESHNHPSAVVPYQGAATGVGGILRDIFTMGAEPIALLNSLHFDIRSHRGKWIAEHVVDGIADYGNCTGIPTVGGEYQSYPWYTDNPLVNVVCVGKLHPDHVLKASTAQVGDRVLYFGNKTGRDGIAGAIFASLNLTEETREQKSAVQVGDPFMGKLIMEATLELIRSGVPSAMQDMGAAGITCSTSEIAHNSSLGIRVDLDAVPVRAPGITAEEILLSESQERMLATVPPERQALAEEILNRYPLDYGWIGTIEAEPKMVVTFQGQEVAAAPLALLVDGCPVEDYTHLTPDRLRQGRRMPAPSVRTAGLAAAPPNPAAPQHQPDLTQLLATYRRTSHLASSRYIYEQFDYEINQRTLGGPGDAHTLMWEPESQQAVAVSVYSRSPWTLLHAYQGTRAVLAGAARQCIAAGAYPLGLSNCLNFPSPEREETMLDFGGTTLAMGEWCEAWQVPVTGGNVSFYNESDVGAIAPTPVFVLVGKSVLGPDHFRYAGETGSLYTFGTPDVRAGEIYHQWLLQAQGALFGARIPPIDFEAEQVLARHLLTLLQAHGRSVMVRAIGKGGLYKRLLEQFARPDRDVVIAPEWADAIIEDLFGEGPMHYMVFLPNSLDPTVEEQLLAWGGRRWATVEEGDGHLRLPQGGFVDWVPDAEWAAASLEPFWADAIPI